MLVGILALVAVIAGRLLGVELGVMLGWGESISAAPGTPWVANTIVAIPETFASEPQPLPHRLHLNRFPVETSSHVESTVQDGWLAPRETHAAEIQAWYGIESRQTRMAWVERDPIGEVRFELKKLADDSIEGVVINETNRTLHRGMFLAQLTSGTVTVVLPNPFPPKNWMPVKLNVQQAGGWSAQVSQIDHVANTASIVAEVDPLERPDPVLELLEKPMHLIRRSYFVQPIFFDGFEDRAETRPGTD